MDANNGLLKNKTGKTPPSVLTTEVQEKVRHHSRRLGADSTQGMQTGKTILRGPTRGSSCSLPRGTDRPGR